ncbi:Globin [Zootermopsis nevadensis]|uniref:Globin n=1 Tax=Zootermopsis nevadensis TaxID=136037 RepID=A0A067RP63_ZOONE|nr:Globin [Zootermopsis nevadensis]
MALRMRSVWSRFFTPTDSAQDGLPTPDMGSLLSSLVGGNSNPALDIPDPDTGLTQREKMAVRRNWDIVKANIKQNGIELLIMFFEANPSHQRYFKSFRDVPLKDLPSNNRFQAHCTSVMYALTSIVDNLDDTGCLVEMLTKLGQNHRKHGISRQEFNDLKITLLKLLKKKLGSKFTCEDEAAWKKMLDVAFSVIFTGMDEDQGKTATYLYEVSSILHVIHNVLHQTPSFLWCQGVPPEKCRLAEVIFISSVIPATACNDISSGMKDVEPSSSAPTALVELQSYQDICAYLAISPEGAYLVIAQFGTSSGPLKLFG